MQDIAFIAVFLIALGVGLLIAAWAVDSECKREEGR